MAIKNARQLELLVFKKKFGIFVLLPSTLSGARRKSQWASVTTEVVKTCSRRQRGTRRFPDTELFQTS